MAFESGATKFRAIDNFTRQYPNKKIKQWMYVDQANYDLIKVYTETEILTVQYDPELKKSVIIENDDFSDTLYVSQAANGCALRCPQCDSSNVNVQMVSESHLRNKHHGCIWWLLVGWWWLPVKWLFFTLPALIFKLFAPKRQEITTEHHAMCVCQNCGHSWNA